MPLGFRRGSAAVNNAEFYLARDRALLREQERQVIHDLSNTLAEADRAYSQVEINLNRYLAAQDALEGLEANRREGLTVNLEQLLDIQRRLTEAQSRYYLSRVEYAVALKNVHVEKGSILEYADLHLVDSMAPISAAMDDQLDRAAEMEGESPPLSQPGGDVKDENAPASPETSTSDQGANEGVAALSGDANKAIQIAGHRSDEADMAPNPFEAATVKAKSPTQARIRISSRQPTPSYTPEPKEDLFDGALSEPAQDETAEDPAFFDQPQSAGK
jgi:hypothetical protein